MVRVWVRVRVRVRIANRVRITIRDSFQRAIGCCFRL